ncbi:MAG: TonB-dependent receptor plug, partial [Flavipsychrobacter sp.]|nr:TonB-dependent receptor plug [Flavipsychrobacter sp.]
MQATMRIIAVLLSLFVAINARSQNSFHAVVKDKSSRSPVSGAIVADKNGHGGASNDSGIVTINGLNAGAVTFYISYNGYSNDSIAVTMPDNTVHEIVISENENTLDEVIVVSSTRTNERIENAPTKVEVLGSEDMKEENTIRPANIASILSDVSGIQLQQSSAVSGNTNVRIQGLNGQYTQILRDGMPLYDGFSGGFGVLQVPPLDLKQVELIKGSASTLYGGGAIGGLINLISRKPTTTREAVFTLNATTLNEQDMNAYLAKRYSKFGYTLFAGYIQQSATDVNADGFSDVPELHSVTIHPRLFFYPDPKTTITLGYNGTFEKRTGGDIQVINHLADSTHQYYEQNITQRNTGELIFERALPGLSKLTVKGSASSFRRDIATNLNDIKGNQLNYYTEASIFSPLKKNSAVAGINITGNHFRLLPGSEPIAMNSFGNDVAGAFAQYTLHLLTNTTLEGGLRVDHTFQYGDFILPRITAFHRFNETWAMRAGAGFGYKTPNPLEVQVIDYPLNALQPLPANIKAERSMGYNLEGNYKKEFGNDVNLFINHAFFLTQITDAVIATPISKGSVIFRNAGKEVTTMGFDTYAKLDIRSLELYIGYTYTDARRKYLSQNQFMPLTPRDRFAFTAVKTLEEKWRIGLEGSYIGVE